MYATVEKNFYLGCHHVVYFGKTEVEVKEVIWTVVD